LLKTPGFTAIAVLTLAVGLGMNTAVFTVVDTVMLRVLPYPDPSRLVSLWEEVLREQPGTMNSYGAPIGNVGGASRYRVSPANRPDL